MRFISCILAVIVLGSLGNWSFAQSPKRPNIIVILSDDMGFSDIGCYGGEIPTPNLDKLAAEGVRFTQFYNCARCCPSRACLLTGLYPHMANMGWMTSGHLPLSGYGDELTHNAVTIPEVLHTAGYATYMVGKWHVTGKDGPTSEKDNWPMQRGFERFYGTIKGGGSYYDPAVLTRGNTPITPVNDPEYHPEHYYYTDAIADQASRFIREHKEHDGDKPFFMYVAFTASHWPMQAPADAIAKFKGKYEDGYEPIRAARFAKLKTLGLIDPAWDMSPQPLDWADQKHKAWESRCMEVYAAMANRMDGGVGEIVSALHDTNDFDNTLILYMEDNGGCAEPMGRRFKTDLPPTTAPMKPDEIETSVRPAYTRDGRLMRGGPGVMPGPDDTFIAYGKPWANVSNTPFREYKHFVHEGGISTPLIAHWPDGISRHGEIETQPAHFTDLMSTFIELAGATYPKEFAGHKIVATPGISIVPAFEGKPLDRKIPIFWEHEGNRAIRSGDWKLVAKGPKGAWELYNMKNDRTEMHNLAAEQPERVKALTETWTAWAHANNVFPIDPFHKGVVTEPAE